MIRPQRWGLANFRLPLALAGSAETIAMDRRSLPFCRGIVENRSSDRLVSGRPEAACRPCVGAGLADPLCSASIRAARSKPQANDPGFGLTFYSTKRTIE